MTRADLEEACRFLASRIDITLPEVFGERTGFMLFLFDFESRTKSGDKGNVAYISNAQREDVINLLDEIKTYLQAGLITEPHGPRGQV